MNIGALVRTESRGLGAQQGAFVRNMGAKPLVIDVPNNASRHVCPPDFYRYPDAQRVTVKSGWRLPELIVRTWLEGLDIVHTAETFYDDRFCDWAREAGCATVIHANPEFVPASLRGYGLGRPSQWWSATNWRLGHMPKGTRVVPWPCEIGPQAERHNGPTRFLFVGGRTAMADRNGMGVFIEALAHLREQCEVMVYSQDTSPDWAAVRFSNVAVGGNVGSVDRIPYEDHDVLVMPRRYGGLCLPVIEAMAHGLAVIMPAIEPNEQSWPVATFPAAGWASVRMAAGEVRVAAFEPERIALAMDEMANPVDRHTWQEESCRWARGHSWEVLAPEWRRMMTEIKP